MRCNPHLCESLLPTLPSGATSVLTLANRLVFSQLLLRLSFPSPSRAFCRLHPISETANFVTSQPIRVAYPTSSQSPNFSPPKFGILVNCLWFLSLLTSLTGALLAVSIQQWPQSYLQATQGRHNPKERARIRTFYAEGPEKSYLHRVTRTVPTIIHVSIVFQTSYLLVQCEPHSVQRCGHVG